MKIYIEKTNKIVNLEFHGTVISLLRTLKINPEEVIVVKGNDLLSDDEQLKDADEVKVLSVVSGG